jgi:hypothetical protein
MTMEPAPGETVVEEELRRLAHQDMGTAVKEFGPLMGRIAVVSFATGPLYCGPQT